MNLNQLTTEKRNKKTMNLDDLSILEFITIMNDEDKQISDVIQKELKNIEKAIEVIVQQLNKGGRLFYIGSGTSGRLGVLDAVECVPTYSTTNEVTGIIAGGNEAMFKAKEGAEDSQLLGKDQLIEYHFNQNDVLVGIAASGRTPHTIGAINYANEIGAQTIALACNKNSEIGKIAKLKIEIETGPEVITGSTRMKAGTATKMVLNMLSTASMVQIGKTYSNLMVDLKATNEKLVDRTIRIVMEATDCSRETAELVLSICEYKAKTAIVMIILDCSYQEASTRLEKNQHIKEALK